MVPTQAKLSILNSTQCELRTSHYDFSGDISAYYATYNSSGCNHFYRHAEDFGPVGPILLISENTPDSC